MAKETPHPLDVHIGHQLRLRRKMMGWSQAALAAKVSITFQQVQKYERGTNSLSARRLHEFAAVLGISPMYFYHGYGEEAIAVLEENNLSTQAMHLVKNYCAIPSEAVRNSIAAFVREVAREKK